jgi:hypothetical protein
MTVAENIERLVTRIVNLDGKDFVEFFKNIPPGGLRIAASKTGIEYDPSYEFIIQPLEKS